jgi:UMP-CMP kinase
MRRFQVVFVLGGPGSGKGTQSALIERHFGFRHLSAGQLLREEQERPSSQFGSTIRQLISEGKIVPSSITIQLLKQQMQASPGKLFVIDGFPRNLENFHSWAELTRDFAYCPFMLHLVCSEAEMLRRLKIRSKEGRSDDTPDIIKKRFQTYREQTLQVIGEFEKDKKVRNMDADQAVDNIFQQIRPIF